MGGAATGETKKEVEKTTKPETKAPNGTSEPAGEPKPKAEKEGPCGLPTKCTIL